MKIKKLLELHKETTEKCFSIMERKSSDYTGGTKAVDALANFKSSRSFDLHPVLGLLLRMQDKLMRVRSFVNDGKLRVTGETVEDACDDMVNYAILCKALLREESSNNEQEQSNNKCECGKQMNYHYIYGWTCDCELRYQEDPYQPKPLQTNRLEP